MLSRIHLECKRISALQSVEILSQTTVFLPRLVKIGCALAVCTWNDGCSSVHGLAQRLELQPTLSSLQFCKLKESSSAKLLKKACRRKRKGNEDNNEAQEGTICPSCKKRRM